jgi:hypothetical protein
LTISAISLVVAAALCRPWKLEGLVTAMMLSEVALAIICARLAENLVFVPKFRMTKDPA